MAGGYRDPVFDEVARREAQRQRALDPDKVARLRRKRQRQLKKAQARK